MKFLVTRTSTWGVEDAPCPEAVQETYAHQIIIPPACGAAKQWKRDGVIHEVLPDGCLCRSQPQLGWFVYFGDLQSLTSFVNTHGKCAIHPPHRGGCLGVPTLEIYDTYRES